MTLPITVIVPHIRRRDDFLERYCLPSVERNDPAQTIVVDGDAVGPQVARNKGAEAARQPFLFFCDDDAVLYPGCLASMLDALEAHPAAGFAYSDFNMVSHLSPEPRRVPFRAGPFDQDRLRRESYVCALSLLRREALAHWDESLRRLQDWDFFLSVTERGWHGAYIDRPLFEAHRIDPGITETEPLGPALAAIRAKHGPVGAAMEDRT